MSGLYLCPSLGKGEKKNLSRRGKHVTNLSAPNYLQVITPGDDSVGSHNLPMWRHLLKC